MPVSARIVNVEAEGWRGAFPRILFNTEQFPRQHGAIVQVWTWLDGLRATATTRGGIIRSQDQDFFQCLLWSDGAVPVEPAAYMEAVTHHALGEQKKDDCQDDYKQETFNSEPGWLPPAGAVVFELLVI